MKNLMRVAVASEGVAIDLIAGDLDDGGGRDLAPRIVKRGNS